MKATINCYGKIFDVDITVEASPNGELAITDSSALPTSRCYVLVYVGEGDFEFFKNQNLYLATILTDSVEQAAMMTIDEAEEKWGRMTVKEDWQIWSVRPGIVLNAKIKNLGENI